MKVVICSLLIVLSLNVAPAVHADVEPWYAYWGIGMARANYPTEVQNAVEELDSFPGVDRTQVASDMLGFYFPAENQKTIYGFVISGAGDRLQDTTNTNIYIQINQYIYGLSAMHFLGNEPGDGLFVRGDAGFARMVVDSPFLTGATEWGNGILLGAGYGWAMSRDTRLLFSASLSSSRIDGNSYSSTMFTIGGLW